MKAITKAVLSMAALTAFGAQAQQAFVGHAYVGGSLGYTDYNGPDIAGLPTDRSSTGFKLHGGWQATPNFAVEVGYAYLGEPGSAAGELENAGFYIDAVGMFPVYPGFSLLGRIGAFNGRVTSDRLGDSDRNTDLKYGIGIQYDITPQINVRGEWERYRLNVFNQDSDHDMYSIGVNYKF